MKKLIILAFIIFSSINFVYSKTNSELSPIQQAEKLIEEKRFDEAITLLTQYVYQNPKAIYEVQDLLDVIRDEREKSNDLMEELIKTLYDDSNFEEAYRIIEEYEKNNPHPDDLSKEVLKNAREGATFVINQKKFKEYMDIAYNHLNNGDYINALENYLLCLDFHNNEFDLLMDGQDIGKDDLTDLSTIDDDIPLNLYYNTLKNSSFSEVNVLKEETQNLERNILKIEDIYVSIQNDIRSNSLNINKLNNDIQIFKDIPGYIKDFQNIYNKLDDYNELFSRLTKDSSKSKYISFATVTLTGRKDKSEGFLYLINSLYPHYIDVLIDDLQQKLTAEMNNGLNYFNTQNYIEAKNSFNNLKILLIAQDSIASLWKSFIQIDSNYNITGVDILKEKYYLIGDSQVGLDIIDSYQKMIDFSLNLEDNKKTLSEYAFRENLGNNIEEIKSDIIKWNSSKDKVDARNILKYKYSLNWISQLLNNYILLQENLINEEIAFMDNISKETYIAIFGHDYTKFDLNSDLMAERIKEASIPIDSEEEITIYFDINNTDERKLITYNPEISINILDEIENDYEKYIEDLQNYSERFKNEKDYILSNTNFKNRLDSVNNALNLANENKLELVKYKNRANEKIRLSTELENRGRLLYQNALQSFENENFNEARDFIETGKNVATTSISYNKNEYVIYDLIPLFYNLKDEIAQEEARIVIRDVRLLINRGKSEYLSGAYIPASNLFREAELKWAETNSDPHPEIPYWLALIRDALDIESGRYLSITEPLYSILAGYLSFAEDYYRRGVNEANTVDKLKNFAIADSYLTKILEVRPLNERARFLQLQVLKSKDPDAFKIIFNNDFISYRDKTIRAIDNDVTLGSDQIIQTFIQYEEVIKDSYLLNPRLSNSKKRLLLERFYKGVDTAGKTQAQINKEKSDNESNRKIINESYIRFQDLYKIADQDQKNQVKRVIDLSEVALGFRRLPIDTSNIRESNRLFQLANTRLSNTSQTDIDGLKAIITDLQKALNLNPNNQDIPVVIDDILVRLGEESNFQLAPAEDKLFREAQRDFIDGDFFGARDKIIQILNANKKNKNYPKLKDLIKRVEIKIGEEILI